MDTQAKIDGLQQKAAARKAELAEARAAQYLADLEALDALAEQHGDDSLATLEPGRYAKGHPTFVVLKTPSAAQYKRFCDQVSRAAKGDNHAARLEAQNMIAKSCWVYPAEDKQAAMLEAFPGLLLSIAIRAVKLVEAEQAEAGKD